MTTAETKALWFKTYVQSLMEELLNQEVETDSDGDYPVRGETATGWVRPQPFGPWGVEILVYAAYHLPVRATTLKEINEINLAEPLVKVMLSGDGVVQVTLRLLAEAVTVENLGGAVTKVLDVADRVGPMLVAVHGGRTPISAESELALEE